MIEPASVRAPATSIGSASAARDSTIFAATSANASAPSGRLIAKIERHPNDIVRKAPRSGPIRLAAPQMLLKSPWIFARSLIE